MKPASRLIAAVGAFVWIAGPSAGTAGLDPALDARFTDPRGTNTEFTFQAPATLDEWQARAELLRLHILTVNGLWPPPERPQLAPAVTDTVEAEGYSVSKVALEVLPGFFVTGNLYRPLGHGPGPFPAILNPHGHWGTGRLANEENGSVAARCIQFARMGAVAFSHDMLGYVDSRQVPHGWDIAAGHLWGLHPMSLQLWSSIRAVDFLAGLPEVDRERIGCTGASGGGTQTFILTAVDDRIKVAAPVNMISAHFQGGCICENAPYLRLDANNVEIGAMAAPRPLLMISATGDWTKNTLEKECPAVRSVYDLFGAGDRLRAVRIDAPHNYNQQSREAVYAWFGQWLLGGAAVESVPEQPWAMPAEAVLRVFPEDAPPPSSVTPERLLLEWKRAALAQEDALWPHTAQELESFRTLYGMAYQRALGCAPVAPSVVMLETVGDEAWGEFAARHVLFGRNGQGDAVPGVWLTRGGSAATPGRVVIAVAPQGIAGVRAKDSGGLLPALRETLTDGTALLAFDPFLTGAHRPPDGADRKRDTGHFLAFHPTDASCRIQDVVTAAAAARVLAPGARVELHGTAAAGVWALLAWPLAPEVERVVADLAGAPLESDEDWVKAAYIPSIRRLGGLRTALALAAPGSVDISAASPSFPRFPIEALYRALGAADRCRIGAAK